MTIARWVAILGFGLAACAPTSDLPMHTMEGAFQGSATEGRLVSRNNCLFLQAEKGGLMAVAWPKGTTWDPATGQVSVRGTTATLGEMVILGGSGLPVTALDSDELWETRPTTNCLADEGIWMAGSLERVEAAP